MEADKENDAPEPNPDDWAWLDKIKRPVDEDFLKAASERPREEQVRKKIFED